MKFASAGISTPGQAALAHVCVFTRLGRTCWNSKEFITWSIIVKIHEHPKNPKENNLFGTLQSHGQPNQDGGFELWWEDPYLKPNVDMLYWLFHIANDDFGIIFSWGDFHLHTLGFYTAIWWSTSMWIIAKKKRNLYLVVIYGARQTNGFVQRGGILALGYPGNPNFVSWFGRLRAKRLCAPRMHLFTLYGNPRNTKTENLWSYEWYGKTCARNHKVHVWLMKKHACGWGSRLLDHIFC